MSKAILRFEKLKSLSAVVSFERHGKDRSRLPNRSHPEREQYNREYIPLIYENKTMVERWRECVGDATVRSNAVFVYFFNVCESVIVAMFICILYYIAFLWLVCSCICY